MTLLRLSTAERPLPHVLEPRRDESLLGFLFRLDAVNDWEPGTVATMLCTHRTGWKHASAAMWASGTIWDLRRLAGLVDQPYEAITALTYLPDIRAAASDPRLAVHALGDSGRLTFCPACFASTGTTQRFCLLPLMRGCPHHEVRLISYCPSHAPVLPELDPVAGIIRCGSCSRILSSATGEPLPDEERAHQLDVWRAWAFLLGWRGDDIRARGYRTIRSVTRNYPLRNLGETVSFERLVTVFLALQIEPDLVAQLEERPAPPCPNAACPRYVAPGPDDPLLRGRLVERHCSTCGSRFIGRRLLLCFDAHHGGDRPSPRSVQRAQRRLARWREDLAETCRQDILAGRRITVTGTFRRAGVPANANLRATRLGLVALVRDAARRQRLLEGGEPAAFASTTMAEYRLIRDLAHEADWRELAAAAHLGRIRPNEIAPSLGWLARDPRDPRGGVLDSLFGPAWVLRHHLDPAALRARVDAMTAKGSSPWWALSDPWEERVDLLRETGRCSPVVPHGAYPQRTRPEGLEPGVRAFVLGEWSPDWMPRFIDGTKIRPPSASPFA